MTGCCVLLLIQGPHEERGSEVMVKRSTLCRGLKVSSINWCTEDTASIAEKLTLMFESTFKLKPVRVR